VATQNVFYAIESLVYLLLFVVIVVTLRGIRREIKRIADGMEEAE
jgi:hypothetical protein